MDLSSGSPTRRAMFSTAIRTDWRTPKDLFRSLNDEFGFTCDVASSDQNHLCDSYFTEQNDAFKYDWDGVCFCNPPYGRAIGRWVAKAASESERGTTVVCLLPARTDTSWFHQYILPVADEIRFICGRLYFDDGTKGRAPFPSMIVVYRGKENPNS